MSTPATESLRSQMLTAEDLAAVIGVTVSTLADWRSQGRGPAYLKFGRKIFYHVKDTESWIEEQRHGAPHQKRPVGIPLRRQGPKGSSRNRFGGYRTKSEKGRPAGNGSQASDSGGPL